MKFDEKDEALAFGNHAFISISFFKTFYSTDYHLSIIIKMIQNYKSFFHLADDKGNRYLVKGPVQPQIGRAHV